MEQDMPRWQRVAGYAPLAVMCGVFVWTGGIQTWEPTTRGVAMGLLACALLLATLTSVRERSRERERQRRAAGGARPVWLPRGYMTPVATALFVVVMWIFIAIDGRPPRKGGYLGAVFGTVVALAASAVAMKRRGW